MSRSGRTVLVLGSQGVLGSVLAQTFADERWDVVRAGRRPAPELRLVDLDRPETLSRALDGIDVVANPYERLIAERLVLERGPVLVNVSAVAAAHGWALKRQAASARA